MLPSVSTQNVVLGLMNRRMLTGLLHNLPRHVQTCMNSPRYKIWDLLKLLWLLKIHEDALAEWLSWFEHCATHPKGCRFNSQSGHITRLWV